MTTVSPWKPAVRSGLTKLPSRTRRKRVTNVAKWLRDPDLSIHTSLVRTLDDTTIQLLWHRWLSFPVKLKRHRVRWKHAPLMYPTSKRTKKYTPMALLNFDIQTKLLFESIGRTSFWLRRCQKCSVGTQDMEVTPESVWVVVCGSEINQVTVRIDSDDGVHSEHRCSVKKIFFGTIQKGVTKP